MSLRQYAGHAELGTAVNANDEVNMLDELVRDFPIIAAYPVSGDMIAVMKRGEPSAYKRRRRLAAAVRRCTA